MGAGRLTFQTTIKRPWGSQSGMLGSESSERHLLVISYSLLTERRRIFLVF